MTERKRDPAVRLAESGTATDALTIAVQEGDWAFATTGGGWVQLDNGHGDRLVVRFAMGERGRLEPVELRLDAKRPIDSTMLRRLPLTTVDGLANGPLRNALLNPASDPSPPAGPLLVPMRRGSELLKVPPGAKPDWFYERVAAAYSSLARRSNRPAVLLAERNEVPVTTVHRWVKEARRRGFLPPGQKGRRG